jgi:hypothetical protein
LLRIRIQRSSPARDAPDPAMPPENRIIARELADESTIREEISAMRHEIRESIRRMK